MSYIWDSIIYNYKMNNHNKCQNCHIMAAKKLVRINEFEVMALCCYCTIKGVVS